MDHMNVCTLQLENKHPVYSHFSSLLKNKDSTVRDIVRYAVINELKRRPFRRDEISKAGLLGSQTRKFEKLLEQCNHELASVFGMELVEMRSRGQNAEQLAFQNAIQQQAAGDEDAPAKSQKVKGGSARHYILRSSLKPSLLQKVSRIVDDEILEDDVGGNSWDQPSNSILDWKHGDELGHLGFLGLVLALILMHNRSIENSQLLIYLKRLKVQDNWQPPSTPACAHAPQSLTALLNQFTRQGYLEATQQAKSGRGGASQVVRRQSQIAASDANQEIEWRWGARAEIEFGEKQIAEFMSDIYRAAKGKVDNQPDNPVNKRKLDEAQHQKLMNDIAKAAGGDLQDSSKSFAPGLSRETQ